MSRKLLLLDLAGTLVDYPPAIFRAVTYGYGFSPNDLVTEETPRIIAALAELPEVLIRLFEGPCACGNGRS